MGERKTGTRRISDKAVQAGTGKGWDEWFRLLDARHTQGEGHTARARHLREQYGLSPWWAQVIAIRYEWERGLRGEGQERSLP
jgi:hypothetical protein